MSDINALVAVNFSLIGTKLRAAYEKQGDKGYAILLMPSEQEADNAVSIGEVVKDIQKLVSHVDNGVDTDNMSSDLQNGLSGLSGTGGNDGKSGLDNLTVQLTMAFLYILKTDDKSVLEYAFQLNVNAKDVIPKGISDIVNVENVSISIWNTNRKKVVEKMALVTIDEYIGSIESADETK